MGFMLIIFAGILDVIANLCLKKPKALQIGFGDLARLL